MTSLDGGSLDLGSSSGGSGGATYVQDSEPSSPSSGETWYDTGNGMLYVYADKGGGGDWWSVPPTQILEEVSTFSESGITVTTTDTTINSKSIELASKETGSTIDYSTSTSTTDTTSGRSGVQINPNNDLSGLNVTLVMTGTQPSTLEIWENSLGNKLASKDISSNSDGDTVQITASLSAGTDYEVVGYNGGSSWEFAHDGGGTSFPKTSTDFDLVAGVNGGSIGTGQKAGVADPIEAVITTNDATSGDALISWDSGVPTDISSWDIATFQKTENNETVTVDIEDSNGNVLHSDIPQNFDISTVSNSTDVQFRINLSRNDTSNNPTCDYLARRFLR